MNGTVENLPISRFITPGWLSFTSTVHCSFWPLAFVYRRWCRNFRSSPKPFPVKTPLKLRSVAPDTKGKSFRKRQSAVNSHWLKITSKVSFYMIASKAKALCDLWWPRRPLMASAASNSWSKLPLWPQMASITSQKFSFCSWLLVSKFTLQRINCWAMNLLEIISKHYDKKVTSCGVNTTFQTCYLTKGFFFSVFFVYWY